MIMNIENSRSDKSSKISTEYQRLRPQFFQLGCNLHTVQYTDFKCTFQWALSNVTNTIVKIKSIFITPESSFPVKPFQMRSSGFYHHWYLCLYLNFIYIESYILSYFLSGFLCTSQWLCIINFVSCNYHSFYISLHSIPNCGLNIFVSVVMTDISVYFFNSVLIRTWY